MTTRTALVTGGASGIGKAIAEQFVEDGYNVAILDLNPGDSTHAYRADVTQPEQIAEALDSIHRDLGDVTILVNAAGLDAFTPFADIEYSLWRKLIDVNLDGVFHTVKAVLPDMLRSGWGRIINISSSSTQSGAPNMAHYVAAKSAVNGLTKCLALEYGPSGITVNAIPPGSIDTPMLRAAEKNGDLGGLTVDQLAQWTPVRRVGKPEDIAAACSFLASEGAGFITGQLIGVNGGQNT